VDDGEPYWSPALSNVTVNGKKVDASVFNVQERQHAVLLLPGDNRRRGKGIEITDLDVPADGQPSRPHGNRIGRNGYERSGNEMLRKEINEVSKGDNISVGVQVKLPKGLHFCGWQTMLSGTDRRVSTESDTSSDGKATNISMFSR